tara:strand:- start:24237 stop:29087 length:4851 start_codon:yes stop_codon:yes gene_type:complete
MSILSRRGSINTGSVDTRPGIVNRGFWNADTNTTTDSSFPSLQSGVGVKNYYYVVSVAGTTDLDGITDWQPNDWALFDGTSWEKIDNSEAGSGDVTGPSSAIDNNIATYNSTSGKIIQDGGSKIITEAEGITGNDNDASVPTAAAVKDFVDNHGGTGGGDVTGPSSSTNANLVSFDGTTGKVIQDSSLSTTDVSSAVTQTNTNTTNIATNTTNIATNQTNITNNANQIATKAASGANSDITSISGLTTALSVAQGGTGSTTDSGARTNLGLGSLAVKNTVGSGDIDSGAVDTNELASDAVTTPKITDGNVSDAKLGSGINANKIGSGNVDNTEFGFLDGATSNLQTQISNNATSITNNATAIAGKAGNGVNTDITEISGLTTALSVAQGGTGASTATNARSNLGLGSLATQSSVTDTDIAAGVNADKIANGTVSNTEFEYLDGVTSAIQTQLNAKAALASPAFTGNPTAPTQADGDNSTKIATTAYVDAQTSPNNKGFFATPTALRTAYPTGQDGWYAIVGSTDTFWVWDTTTTDWVDTDSNSLGTVTSIGITAGTGITSAGGPVTTSGSITVGLDAATQTSLAQVTTNTTDIANNALAISTNTSDIATNTSAIATKISASSSDTLTNKTIDVDSNTLSNVEVDNFKASAIVIESEGIGNNDNDTTIPTSAAVKDYVDTTAGGTGTVTSVDVTAGTGIASSGGPVTTNGSITVGLDASTQASLAQVATNTTDIVSNAADIATNTSNISTNTANITSNTTAISTKADIASPALTGNPTAPTQGAGDNSTKLATTAYADTAVSNLSLDTRDLSDVSATLPAGGQVLEYSTTTSKYEPVTLSLGTGTVTSVDVTAGTGITSSGGPVTNSGSITVGLDTATQNTLAQVSTNTSNIASNTTNIAANTSDIATNTSAIANLATSSLTDVSSTAPTNNQVLQYNSASSEYQPVTLSTGSGDVTGPSSSTDTNIASFDGTTGKIIQDGGITTSAISSAISQTNTNTTDIASNTTAIGTKISASSTDTLTNKTIDADSNTISNIDNNEIKAAAGIEATKISSGIISNTEFDYLNGVTSNIQTQINSNTSSIASKANTASPTFTGTVTIPTLSATDIQTTNFQLGTTAVAGYVLKTDASGNGTWQVESGGGGGTALPYKIVRTTGGDYSTVYAAVQAGEQYIFVDGTSAAVVESNDIVSSGQTEVTSDVYIKVVGEWQPKRFMQSTSNDLVIEAGNGIWSGTVKMQIPTTPTQAEFLGRSSAFGTETNQTILDGIVWDTTQMTANDYGKFSPTGVFISRNVKALLPNYSGNGLSWNLNTINAPSLAQGQTVINGGGSSCAKAIELGDELIIDALEISGEFTKNNIESDVLLGSAVVFGDPSNFPMVEIKKINWALSNITSSDAYAIVAGGNLSNFDKPSNQTNSTSGKLELYLYYDESNLDNINFGTGKIVQATGGTNVTVNNCTTIDSVNYNSSGSPSWTGWKFNNCEFSNTTSISVIIPNTVYENCTFASTVQNFTTISQRTFRNCTFSGSVSLSGDKNRVETCFGSSTLTFNGDDNIISNSIIDDTISGNGDRSKFLCNTTTLFNSGITVNGDYNYFAGNTFKSPLSVTGSYNMQPANSNSIY